MFNFIFKNLFRRKTRTLLTVLGIAVGVSMIVALGAIGEGMRTGYASMFGGSGADLTLMQKGSYDVTLSGVDEQAITDIAAVPGIKDVTGMIVGNVSAPGAAYFFVFGYDPKGFAFEKFRLVEGQALGQTHRSASNVREIMIGKQAAEVMKIKVGDLIRLTGGTFKVVGIYSSGDGFEDAASIVSLSDAQQLLQKYRQVGAVQVKVQDPRQIETLRARLEKQFSHLSVTQSGDVANQAQMVQYIQVFAVIIALLALLVGGVGMTNTVMMSMFERTREIGTLRAIGWRRRRVMTMIFGESLMLGLVGGAIGCALGAGMVTLLSANSAIGYLQGTVTPSLIALGLITAIGLGAMGGFYPAWRASKMLPIEALQYQGGTGKEAIKKASRVKSETFRSLQRRRGRTYMTITGISIALASIIMLSSITDGFVAAFNKMMVSTDVELVARQKDASDTSYSAISEKVGRQIAATPGVESVSGIVFGAMVVDEMPFFLIFGYAPYEPAIKHFKIVEGRGLQSNREIILGRKALEGMKTQIGQVVRLGEVGFRVVGMYETGVSYEESAGVMSLRDAQELTGKPRQVSMYGIKVKDPAQAEAIQKQLEAALPDVSIGMASTFAENLPDLKSMNVMMLGIALLAIVVGGISMMNTMIMSVYERTREIGTLRAVGWRRRRVLAMILKESVVLSLLGTAVGFASAIGLMWLMQFIPAWGDFMEITISPDLLAMTASIALTLGAIGGLYPAWRASNLRPVEALRYE
ncbi:MAG TPA: ABC transporter permease [Anaerolineae bacterium]|nr:ABC transporter permease [Anaerolineae bacterium]